MYESHLLSQFTNKISSNYSSLSNRDHTQEIKKGTKIKKSILTDFTEYLEYEKVKYLIQGVIQIKYGILK